MKKIIQKLHLQKDIGEHVSGLEKDTMVDLFIIIINMCLKKTVSDNYSYNCIKTMFNNVDINLLKFDYYELKDIDAKKYEYTYKLINLQYNKMYYKSKLVKHQKMLKRINGILKIRFVTEDSLQSFRDKLLYTHQLIKAFYDKRFINSLKASSIVVNSNEFSKQDWEFINSVEMRDRLLRINKLLGSRFLKDIGISRLSNKMYNELKFDVKIKYYIDITKKIHKCFDDIKDDYVVYLNVCRILSEMLNKEDFEIENTEEENSYKSDSDDEEQEIPLSSLDEIGNDSDSSESDTINDILSTYFDAQ